MMGKNVYKKLKLITVAVLFISDSQLFLICGPVKQQWVF
jgi:hypothetical protein